MKKSIIFLLTISSCILVLASLSIGEEGAPSESVPKILTLDSLSNLYGPVTFKHEMHTKLADSCTDCHHQDSEGEATPCKDCHSTFDPAVDEMPGLKGAYHRKCFECHEIKAGSDPAGCSGKCHTRK